jgi:hypothetical protein
MNPFSLLVQSLFYAFSDCFRTRIHNEYLYKKIEPENMTPVGDPTAYNSSNDLCAMEAGVSRGDYHPEGVLHEISALRIRIPRVVSCEECLEIRVMRPHETKTPVWRCAPCCDSC